VDDALRHQADIVLEVLSHARRVFGADQAPADPPAFVAPADLEQRLGDWF
jgi:hypothetical protein